jgi:hypothetical protein
VNATVGINILPIKTPPHVTHPKNKVLSGLRVLLRLLTDGRARRDGWNGSHGDPTK